jgi:HD superfamily phosphodiesterase
MEQEILDLDDIVQMTLRDGKNWAVAHAQRLLKIIECIGEGMAYDASALTLAVYMHDWGAFPAYAEQGVEHALRSSQVVETEILPRMDLSPQSKQVILDAIRLHDYRDPRPTRSIEALLLREADMIDFLGMVGIARDLARKPKDLAGGYRLILNRRSGIRNRLTLPRAVEMARVRLDRMQQCLGWLEEESFGIL